MKNEQFHDYNLSKYLLENYPSLDFNVAPTEAESGGIQLNIQLALFNIISMVIKQSFVIIVNDSSNP